MKEILSLPGGEKIGPASSLTNRNYFKKSLVQLIRYADNLIPITAVQAEKKFEKSIILQDIQQNIVGSISVSPVELPGFNNYKLGSIGSLVLENSLRGKGYGSMLMEHGTVLARELYDVLISISPNDKVKHFRYKKGFQEIINPYTYYKEAEDAFVHPDKDPGQTTYRNNKELFFQQASGFIDLYKLRASEKKELFNILHEDNKNYSNDPCSCYDLKRKNP